MFFKIFPVLLIFNIAIALPSMATPILDILSGEDAVRYRKIFSTQDKGQFKKADREIRQLRNKVLLGHTKFQRLMHPTAYRSRYSELRDWLENYRDHPEAYRVFSLAMKRKPKKAKDPKKPVFDPRKISALVTDSPENPALFTGRQNGIQKEIRKLVRRGKNNQAARLLKSKKTQKILSNIQQDILTTRVAMGYFVSGKDKTAYKLAASAAARSGLKVGQSHWVAGLAAFRSGDIGNSLKHFEANALAEGATSWTAAAGAFWAGRVHQANDNSKAAERWMKIAAQHELTFYGQLALQALDLPNTLDWQISQATDSDIDSLSKIKAGKRALALLQIGEIWRADQEMHQIVDNANESLLRIILSVAITYQAPRTAIKAANQIKLSGGKFVPAGLYPIASWKPPIAEHLDPALLNAFMRQESLFNPRAVSAAGARGLMQLLPATANYTVGKNKFVGARRDQLFNPGNNIAIAAQYIHYLMEKEAVNSGLFELAIAYNAGIGNLRRWQKSVKSNGDPLLFIEAIPSRETRVFVEKVMANYWIYREQMGKHMMTRYEVLNNRWPRYAE